MIRKLIPVFLVAGLAACASSGTQRATPDGAADASSPAGAPMSECDAQRVQDLVGQKYSDSVGNDARERSQSAHLRVMRPGQVMTMEYNPTRLNVILDAGDVITALRCG